MKRIIIIATAALLLSACATGQVQWSPIGKPKSSLAEAKTDCEHKTRQVAHTFGKYDTSGMQRFVFTCMESHGWSGQWVGR